VLIEVPLVRPDVGNGRDRLQPPVLKDLKVGRAERRDVPPFAVGHDGVYLRERYAQAEHRPGVRALNLLGCKGCAEQ